MTARPVLYLVEGAVDVTGGFTSAARQASLMRDAVDTVLVIARGSRLPPAALAAFAGVLRIPMIQLRRSPAGLLLYLPSLLAGSWQLRRAMRADGCERLQVNDFYLMHGAVLRLLGFGGTIVTWVRIDPAVYGGPVARLWLRLTARSSNAVVAVSRFIAGRVPAALAPRLVYNPFIGDPRMPGPGAPRPPTFLFIGNYIDGKGQDLAIRAFHQVAPDFPGARLDFLGGDMGLAKNRAYRKTLEALAAAGPAGSAIHFGEFIDDPRAALAGARAALVLSESESFSLTCQEAGACGVPVIATRCGGPEEIVEDGVTGFLVAVGDSGAVAARMRTLLADPARAAAMGAAAATLVRDRFAPARFERDLCELFDLQQATTA